MLGVAACHTEHTVFYRRMDDLIRDFRLAREDTRDYQRLLVKLRTVDVNRSGFNRGKEIGKGTLLSCRSNTLMN
ncbi:hypothetical protein GCM10009526_26460 [Glutamicibacter creatinolyticus]